MLFCACDSLELLYTCLAIWEFSKLRELCFIFELGFSPQFNFDLALIDYDYSGKKWSMVKISESAFPKPGDWVKGKLVGSGSFGTVHLAMNKSTGGLFVVKSAHTMAGFLALENEAKILKILDSSPYVVQCLGSERDGGILNVHMEYMAGGSLGDVAEKFGGSLPEQVVRLYTKEILKGLNHLHQHGIVHCDLKCKNVLLGSSGNIKLGDFGCAKRVNDLKNGDLIEKNSKNPLESLSGTPLWMAPEVLRNENLGFAADIWSLGCTVIEMATGKAPWCDDSSKHVSNPIAALLRIACGDEKPQFPAHFSTEALDFLSKCLERDSRKRWTSEELLRHPFVSRDSSSSSLSSSQDVPQKAAFASSPASVLGVQSFEDSYDLDDELESLEGNNDFSIKTPFAWCKGNEFESSENWINVRSG